ncbi:MerR family transcriptional regulator [Clostridium ljungdahlii]|uniref:MerR family transcriptional regulator n=1 Tax=Clostridium ljungdahlii TaxID=1538 RepID=UPI00386953CE
MNYSIGDISKMLDISISTLRYYDKEGLLPLVNRTSGNIRIFNDTDVECLKMISCLKNTGMPLKDIKQFLNGVKKAILPLSSDMSYSFIRRKKRKSKLHSYKMRFTVSIINANSTEYQRKGELLKFPVYRKNWL